MSLDILSPLAGDTVSPGSVTIVVAYDFSAHSRRAPHHLTCTFARQSQTHTVGDGPDQELFTFNGVTVGTTYRAAVTVDTSPPQTDHEAPIIVQGSPTIEIKDAEPPQFDSGRTGGKDAAESVVTGTAHGFSGVFKLRVYKIKPARDDGKEGFLRRLVRTLGFGAIASKRPFGDKFTPHGPKEEVTAAPQWGKRMKVPGLHHDLIVRATMDGEDLSSPRSTRGVRFR